MPIELELHVDDEWVTTVCGSREEALAELRHYWGQYAGDGRCTVYEVTRKQLDISDVLNYRPAKETRADTCEHANAVKGYGLPGNVYWMCDCGWVSKSPPATQNRRDE